MIPKTLQIMTSNDSFYEITQQVKDQFSNTFTHAPEGVLYIYMPHTSCALTINESFDPTAKEDMENFLRHLAPDNLSFIKHTSEGADDSPSHMKSILLQTSLTIPAHKGELMLGTWQGIYLCEFRNSPKQRSVILKYIEG